VAGGRRSEVWIVSRGKRDGGRVDGMVGGGVTAIVTVGGWTGWLVVGSLTVGGWTGWLVVGSLQFQRIKKVQRKKKDKSKPCVVAHTHQKR
jgi:hypothetical protein